MDQDQSRLVARHWNGTLIARRTNDGYVNATAMCKANNKLWGNYFATDRAINYLEALSEIIGIPVVFLYQSETGRNGGTYVHPQVAIDLARWISAPFAVWMDKWFLESTQQAQTAPVSSPPILGRAQEVSAIYLMMAEELKKIGVKPGIAVASAFSSIEQETGISTAGMMKSLPPIDTDAPQLNPSQLGEILGLSAKAVNKRLEAAGLQWRTGKGVWQLTEKGQKYGGAFPYSKNNHTGFQIRWVRDVLKVIKD